MDNPTCDLCQVDLALEPVGQQTADSVLCLACLRRLTGATTPPQTGPRTDNPNRAAAAATETDPPRG